MKLLHISKLDFDDILYPLIGTIPTKGGASELKTVMKILDKLEDRASPDSAAISEALGQAVLFKLNHEKARFSFQDAEAAIITARLEEGIKSLSPLRSRVIPAMIEQLKEDIPDAVPDDAVSDKDDAPALKAL